MTSPAARDSALQEGMAFLLIDVQVNQFDPAYPVADGEQLLERVNDLLGRARAAQVHVILVRNCGGEADPDIKGTPGWELHPAIVPAAGETLLDKTTCDTFASTSLGEDLARLGVRRLVIAGLQSDYCIRETTLGALDRGFNVTLVSDAHSTVDGGGKTAAEKTAAVNAELGGRVRLVPADEVRFG